MDVSGGGAWRQWICIYSLIVCLMYYVALNDGSCQYMEFRIWLTFFSQCRDTCHPMSLPEADRDQAAIPAARDHHRSRSHSRISSPPCLPHPAASDSTAELKPPNIYQDIPGL
jgi:hypothetical protein